MGRVHRMASNKNQHFVPRVFLRAFSQNGLGRAINLYNIDARRGIENAPLKSQCSKSYFYGEDLTLERILQHSEGLYAQALARLRQPGYALNDVDRVILRHFCFLQHCRTDAAARRAAFMPAAMADIAFDGSPPASWRMTQRENVVLAMQAFSDTMRIVYDLNVALIENQTGLPFVASDDPSILTNRWYLQDRRAKGMSGAAGNAGALFILPLSPTIACVLYDSDVYALGHDKGWVRVRDVSDVEALNEQQYLNCAANIYFSRWDDLERVSDAFERVRARRPETRHVVTVSELESEEGGYRRYRVVPLDQLSRERNTLVHVRSITPEPTRWPSFLKWRSTKRIYTNGSGTGFVRKATLQEGFFRGTGYRRIS
jgi:hypothetical protein